MAKITVKKKSRITIEVSDGIKKLFDVKCAEVGESKRVVITELIYLWYKGKINIPGQN